jgi:hypothetical protein
MLYNPVVFSIPQTKWFGVTKKMTVERVDMVCLRQAGAE